MKPIDYNQFRQMNATELSEQEKYEKQMQGFFYTIFILLTFASIILYFMLRQICYQEREYYAQIQSRSGSAFGCRSQQEVDTAMQDDRALRSNIKKQICMHLIKMGQLHESIIEHRTHNSTASPALMAAVAAAASKRESKCTQTPVDYSGDSFLDESFDSSSESAGHFAVCSKHRLLRGGSEGRMSSLASGSVAFWNNLSASYNIQPPGPRTGVPAPLIGGDVVRNSPVDAKVEPRPETSVRSNESNTNDTAAGDSGEEKSALKQRFVGTGGRGSVVSFDLGESAENMGPSTRASTTYETRMILKKTTGLGSKKISGRSLTVGEPSEIYGSRRPLLTPSRSKRSPLEARLEREKTFDTVSPASTPGDNNLSPSPASSFSHLSSGAISPLALSHHWPEESTSRFRTQLVHQTSLPQPRLHSGRHADHDDRLSLHWIPKVQSRPSVLLPPPTSPTRYHVHPMTVSPSQKLRKANRNSVGPLPSPPPWQRQNAVDTTHGEKSLQSPDTSSSLGSGTTETGIRLSPSYTMGDIQEMSLDEQQIVFASKFANKPAATAVPVADNPAVEIRILCDDVKNRVQGNNQGSKHETRSPKPNGDPEWHSRGTLLKLPPPPLNILPSTPSPMWDGENPLCHASISGKKHPKRDEDTTTSKDSHDLEWKSRYVFEKLDSRDSEMLN